MAEKEELICPISLDTFTYPVILSPCGHTFDKSSIDSCFKVQNNYKCPICKQDTDGNTNLINRSVASQLNLDIKTKVVQTKPKTYKEDEEINDLKNDNAYLKWQTEHMQNELARLRSGIPVASTNRVSNNKKITVMRPNKSVNITRRE
jgi:SUMO ligase MMS21 Smc5/6 complex component